jgi:hypothetical protein
MAPSTRLRSRPELRVNYAPTEQHDGHTKRKPAARKPAVVEEPRASTSSRRKTTVRVKSGGVVKPKQSDRPKKTECSICATTKLTGRCFKAPVDTCEHFINTCTLCITNMLRVKVAKRRLEEAELSCPFPDCNHALDYTTLKVIVNKAVFHE